MAESLRVLLERAQKAGAVRNDITPTDLLLLIRSTLVPDAPEVPKRVRRRLFDVMVRGLRPEKR
jgi:hypothetical protein